MIEKNIRLQPHHSRDLLVGRRSDGRRPKYQPPGHRDAPSPSRGGPPGGGGGHHSPPSRSAPAPSRPAPAPSGPPGGGDRQMTYSAPSPDRQDRARQQAAIEQAAREVEKVLAEPKINIPSNEELLKTGILQGPNLPITTGEGMIPGPIQGVISQPNIPITRGGGADIIPAFVPRKTTTVTGGNPFLEGPYEKKIVYEPREGPARTYDPRTDPNALLQRGSGIMGTVKDKSIQMAKDFATRKAMKALGLGALNPFLGVGSWLLNKFAPGKKAALKSNITNLLTRKSDDLVGTSDWQGEKKRTFHEGEGGDKQQATTIQEAVAGKKSLGIDFEDLRKRQSIMKTALDEGYYTDNEGRRIQLTDQHKKMLTNYITQIDKYLVDPRAMSAYGGRIDKALGGRSRDIG